MKTVKTSFVRLNFVLPYQILCASLM